MSDKIDLERIKLGLKPFDIEFSEELDKYTLDILSEILLKQELDEDDFCLEFATTIKDGTERSVNLDNLRTFEQNVIKRKQKEQQGSRSKQRGSSVLANKNAFTPQTRTSAVEILSIYGTPGGGDSMNIEAAFTPKTPVASRSYHYDEKAAEIHNENITNTFATPKNAGEFAKTPKLRCVHDFKSFSPRIGSREVDSGILSKAHHGEILSRYRKGITGTNPATSRVELSGKTEYTLQEPYKYMFQKSSMVADIFSEEIEKMTDQIAEAEQISRDDFINVRRPCQEKSFVSGMIYNEEDSGRITMGSVCLQGSDESSMGCSVKLDLSECPDFAVFPGKIAVFEGTNPSGEEFIVSRQIHEKPLEMEPITDSSLGEMDIMIAAGPFTTNDGYDYEPLYELLKRVIAQKPHVLILVGPFVDTEQEWVSKCFVECSFQELFDRLVVRVGEMVENLPTQVIFMPNSSRDAHVEPIFPSAPLSTVIIKSNAENIHFMPDPCLVGVEGVTMGALSLDILRALNNELINGGAGNSFGGDRMARLVKYVLRQKRFYPVYPAPLGVNIEYEQAKTYAALASAPQLLILPSDLTPFIKDVDGVVAVNPGRLTIGNRGGTFAELRVTCKKSRDNSVADCTDGQIVKIL